ncbi:hypothetical protein M422DRAFT_55595 [Sphaerobolus stellatus SS14]|uniref:Uncharacterized protein n=1 Tax=Sphaerobolus stellatus (strain SS14) TaxID=990650 RepID=A0A0C9UM26_SPHS4|nr:hypothetical protein M422DRAFT_55595 [Sphaerobolus stellatus SS14]
MAGKLTLIPTITSPALQRPSTPLHEGPVIPGTTPETITPPALQCPSTPLQEEAVIPGIVPETPVSAALTSVMSGMDIDNPEAMQGPLDDDAISTISEDGNMPGGSTSASPSKRKSNAQGTSRIKSARVSTRKGGN